DRADVIDKRLNEARNEIRRWTDYDYVLVNDDLQSTFAGIRAIIAAEHRRTVRAKEETAAFVKMLLGET
ncbi:MAG: guanylate kinase, partial [Methylocella sp.]